MKREFELTEEERTTLLDACKPVICIKVGNYAPRSPQENANAAWVELGRQRGFRPMTVRPVQGKGDRFFTAEAVDPIVDPLDTPHPEGTNE